MSTRFAQFALQSFILKAVNELGFAEPTEIQERLIPTILKGKSAIGQSQTGTGKTHAFLLPIIEKIDPKERKVQAVITAPTRELANQIYQEILKITKHCPDDQKITARCFIGGTDKQKVIGKLRNQPHIAVGTPGRMNDLVREQSLFVHHAKILVIDEADLMLDMGFLLDVDQMAAKMPTNLQMLVFSATIPENLQPFLKKYMENPTYIQIEPRQPTVEKLEHYLLARRHRDKISLCYETLQLINPYLAIVFVNTKKMADEVADQLSGKGLKVGRIHGDLSPRERKRMMKQINDLHYQYIVATDLASRGIDIEGVSHVINYELPTDLDFYIHRVGRTARAGFSGMAITLYEPSDEDALIRLEKRGIHMKEMDIRNQEWVEVDSRNKRKERPKKVNDLDRQARALVRKPKKVKPGYKKKMQAEMEKIKKRQRRAGRKNK